jgi:hypothetical protein
MLVADEIGDSEVLDRQPGVGLDELGRDLVQEVSTSIGDSRVLASERTSRLESVV